jgi:hypothetical protein
MFVNLLLVQVTIKSLQDLDPLLSKKFLSKHEELFVEVACGDQTFRTNCYKVICLVAGFGSILNIDQLDDMSSSDGTAPKSAQIDFGDGGMSCGVF